MAGKNEGTVQPPLEVIAGLKHYRKCVQAYIHSHQYSSALFWADKTASLSSGDVQDVFTLAECFLLTRQFHRGAHCITSKDLDKVYPACKYMAAKCHYESKEYQKALHVLEGVQKTDDDPDIENEAETKPDPAARFPLKNVESSLLLLKGKVYEAMDNRVLATECFKEALLEDVYCYEAFECLVQHQMLSLEEERELMARMPFMSQCDESEDAEIVAFLYENKLKKYSKPCLPVSAVPGVLFTCLQNNFDVLIGEAERHYYNCNYGECFRLTTMVLDKDPYHKECLPTHIACLIELKKTNSLFYLAHRLVDLYPDNALSWFAVGCYYLLSGKNDPARRYLSKATSLDRVFGPAWLAFGHSFAVENEHDQAMAAYFKASKLMKGCHLPLLYIGLEYGLTNNPRLAEKFFSQALAIAPEDPFVLHEIGVIAFQNQEWETAEQYFREALDKVKCVDHTVVAEKWEPLLNNLGHTCRKLKKYDEALEFHEQALVLAPQNASTFTAIGYVHSMTDNSSLAVDYFHKALGLRRDDTFSTAMLGNVIEQLMNEVSPCEGAPNDIPPLEASLASSTAGSADSSDGRRRLTDPNLCPIVADSEMDLTD